MPGITNPPFPRDEFPRYSEDMPWDDLLELCVNVAEEFAEYVKLCNDDVRKELRRGKKKGRIWALAQIRKQYRARYEEKLERYYIDLKSAVDAALQSPGLEKLGQIDPSILEDLTITIDSSMKFQNRQRVVDALIAVINDEEERELEKQAAVGQALEAAQNGNDDAEPADEAEPVAEETQAA